MAHAQGGHHLQSDSWLDLTVWKLVMILEWNHVEPQRDKASAKSTPAAAHEPGVPWGLLHRGSLCFVAVLCNRTPKGYRIPVAAPSSSTILSSNAGIPQPASLQRFFLPQESVAFWWMGRVQLCLNPCSWFGSALPWSRETELVPGACIT